MMVVLDEAPVNAVVKVEGVEEDDSSPVAVVAFLSVSAVVACSSWRSYRVACTR
jgi:hypothetical protein